MHSVFFFFFPEYNYTIFSLSTNPLMDIWIICCFLATTNKAGIHICINVFVQPSFLLVKYLKVEQLVHMVGVYLT